jgi:hypothetical protein
VLVVALFRKPGRPDYLLVVVPVSLVGNFAFMSISLNALSLFV